LRREFVKPDSQQVLRKYNEAGACYFVPKICFYEPSPHRTS
jgi:hypothetical protein